jgi:RNA polymerase sigma factor for flagellar operon FliA
MVAKNSMYDTSKQREQTIIAFAPIVDQVAYRLKRRIPAHIDFEELRSVGYIGLIEAIDRYDDQKNVPFRAYAEIRINGAMLDYLRKEDWMPRSLRQQMKELQKAKELLSNSSREITEVALAEILQMSLSDTRQLLLDSQSRQVVSSEISVGPSESMLLEEVLSDDSDDALTLLEQMENREQVQAALASLSEREQRVLKMYYLEHQNLREIGAALSITESRACQLRKNALKELRRQVKRN